MKKACTLLFFLCTCLSSWCQHRLIPLAATDLATLTDSCMGASTCAVYIDSNTSSKCEDWKQFSWSRLDTTQPKGFVPQSWISKPVYLQFNLVNSGSSAKTMYFFPGISYKDICIFRLQPDGSMLELPDNSRSEGFQPITLAAHDSGTYIAELAFTPTRFNTLYPIFINAAHLGAFRQLHYYRNSNQGIIGYVLSGVLLMMILFNAANYLLSKKKEFLYNCCYAICMFSLIFLATYTDRKSGIFASLFNSYFSFALLTIGTVFYIAFTRSFLDTKNNYPSLHRLLVAEEKILLVLFLLFNYIYFFTNQFWIKNLLENGMKIISLVIGIVYIVMAFRRKNKLMNYLALGNGILILFSIISFLLIIFNVRKTAIFTNAMMYFQLGTVLELIFFLLGLTYKNRIELIDTIKEQEALKLATEKQLFESKLAVLNAQQEERNRISADMHDDLGAGVTAIRLYSELAKNRKGSELIPEINRISNSANELLNNMNAIIWTMNNNNDLFSNMVAYIRSYALEYFENTGINCAVNIDESIPELPVSGVIRRNVFLVVKEALSNIVKHAKATQVTITLAKTAGGVNFTIHDNGVGINLEKLRQFGNGLKNMQSRMEKTHIDFSITNQDGTLITLFRRVEGW